MLDAVLSAAREHLLPGDPVLDTVGGLSTPETIAEGEPIRAVEALFVVSQLELALTRSINAARGGEV